SGLLLLPGYRRWGWSTRTLQKSIGLRIFGGETKGFQQNDLGGLAVFLLLFRAAGLFDQRTCVMQILLDIRQSRHRPTSLARRQPNKQVLLAREVATRNIEFDPQSWLKNANFLTRISPGMTRA